MGTGTRSDNRLDGKQFGPACVSVSSGHLAVALLLIFSSRFSLAQTMAPITNPNPPSTLLTAGSTSVALTVQTASATSCGYSVNVQAQYPAMQAFDQGQGGTTHSTLIQRLTSDPPQVNNVYVRCAVAPDYVLPLVYRAMPAHQSASFPRVANIGGMSSVLLKGVSYAAKYDFLTDSGNTPASVLGQLHKANPSMVILYWINSVEDWTGTLPESYYLHDVNGNRIQDWPTAWLLNMTNPAVAEYQANYFYRGLVGAGLMFDGCFFDSFYFSESNSITSYQGKVLAVDADGDGKQDDQQALNTAWRAGMLHMMNTWRQLLPNAIALSHLNQDPTPDVGAVPEWG